MIYYPGNLPDGVSCARRTFGKRLNNWISMGKITGSEGVHHAGRKVCRSAKSEAAFVRPTGRKVVQGRSFAGCRRFNSSKSAAFKVPAGKKAGRVVVESYGHSPASNDLRNRKPHVDPLRLEEAERLLAMASGQDRALFTVLIFTRLRRNQVLALNWNGGFNRFAPRPADRRKLLILLRKDRVGDGDRTRDVQPGKFFGGFPRTSTNPRIFQ